MFSCRQMLLDRNADQRRRLFERLLPIPLDFACGSQAVHSETCQRGDPVCRFKFGKPFTDIVVCKDRENHLRRLRTENTDVHGLQECITRPWFEVALFPSAVKHLYRDLYPRGHGHGE